jgi:outer membrane receptor protein involved in Fe transport
LDGPFAKPDGLTIQELFPENTGNKAPDTYLTGWANYATGSFPWGNNANQLSWSDTLTKTWGAHSLKVGGSYLYNYRDEKLMGTTQGGYAFTGQFTGDALGDMLLGMPASYSETDTIPVGHWTYHNFEAFVQDDWKASRRLTLNLGVRYYYWGPFLERQHRMTDFSPAHFDPAQAATLDPVSGAIVAQPDPLNGLLLAGQNGVPNTLYGGNYLNNVSPRLGFAWDLTGRGKTVLRGGFGMGYYHPEGTFNLTSNPPYENTVTVNTPDFDNPAQGIPAPLFPPSLQTLQGYWSPTTAQWSVGVQHEVGQSVVVKAAYVANSGWNLPIRQDINQPGPVSGFDFDPAINAGTLH